MHNALQYSHQLIRGKVQPGDLVIDATAGNGHDTLLLARLTGRSGTVLCYDIQRSALDLTYSKLQLEGLTERVHLIHRGHETMAQDLPPNAGVKAVTFNLGYLPGGDHTVITKPETTIQALKIALSVLLTKGIITIVSYHGHSGGQEELSYIEAFLSQIDQKYYDVLRYQFINQSNNPPILFAVEKKRVF